MRWSLFMILSASIGVGCDEERDAVPCQTCLSGPAGTGGAGAAGPGATLEWVHVWGDEASQKATSVAIDPTTDDAYVAGHYSGRVDFGNGQTLPEITSFDSFLVKLDAAGDVMWTQAFGQSGIPPIGAARVVVAAGPNGAVALGGNVVGTTTIGIANPISMTQGGNNPDIFVAKLNADGDPAWAVPTGDASANAVVRDVAFDAEGNIVVTGTFEAGVTTTLYGKSIQADNVHYAAKLDGATGDPLWVSLYPYTESSGAPGGVAVDPMGGATVCGRFQGELHDEGSMDAFLTAAANITDAFALRIDASGMRTWAESYGDANAAQAAEDVAVDATGAMYLAGWHQGAIDFDEAHTANVTDAFVVKLDSAGNPAWSWASVDPDIQQANAIAWKDDRIAIAGLFYQELSLGMPPLRSAGGIDLYVASFDSEGQSLWARSLGGPDVQQPEAVAIGPTGAVVVVGWMTGDLDIGEIIEVAGAEDIVVARFQPD